MKVYAVYYIPKSPEYKYMESFKTKEEAKDFIRHMKIIDKQENDENVVYDIKIEETQK